MQGVLLYHESGDTTAIAPCVACETIIHFDPERVPSLRVDGKRRPLCEPCLRKWEKIHGYQNAARLSPGTYFPLPDDNAEWKPPRRVPVEL